MASIVDRVKGVWNTFVTSSRGMATATGTGGGDYGRSSSHRPDRTRLNISNERSIIGAIYTRIGIDCTAVPIWHVRLDENERFLEKMISGLQYCLSVEANLDQAASMFRQDLFMTMFDSGVIAVVPVDTAQSILDDSDTIDIRTMRVGIIREWMPEHIVVNLYDQRDGTRKDVIVPKRKAAIIENPMFAVMNEPNSTLQRLIRKLNLLDVIDEQSASGKLDVIIQLPYVVKSSTRKEQAKDRQLELETQLKGSKYGVGYIDAQEKITQLNRPAENNLLAQVEYLLEMLYGQLGLTPAIFNGTASEAEMLNYHNRTIEPILRAVTEELKRKFLSKTARSQRQSVEFYRDPFKYMSVKDFAELADKLIRNEMASANELRGVLGWTPSKDPKADELRNPNVPAPEPQLELEAPAPPVPIELKQIK